MSVEVTSVPITHQQQTQHLVDDAQYADYLRYKQFQSLFAASNGGLDSRSSTPSLYAQAAPYHPALAHHPQAGNGAGAAHYPGAPYPGVYPHNANPGYNADDDEEFKGFLSKQFPTIANPAPLGLCAFALTTWVLSMYNVGAWVETEGANQVVMGIALAYGGIVQLLAGMWEMRIGNTFGALAFSSYGGFWIGTAALFINAFGFLDYYAGGDNSLNNALGIYFFAWTLFTFFMCIASHRTSVALFLLFFFLTITFLLLTIAAFLVNPNVHQAAGAFGILTSVIAWYAAFAGLLDRKQQSLFRLPVGDLRAMFPTKEEKAEMQARQERRQASQRLIQSRTMADKQV